MKFLLCCPSVQAVYLTAQFSHFFGSKARSLLYVGQRIAQFQIGLRELLDAPHHLVESGIYQHIRCQSFRSSHYLAVVLLPALLHPVYLPVHLAELCGGSDIVFRPPFRFGQFALQLRGSLLELFERSRAEVLHHTVDVYRSLGHLFLRVLDFPKCGLYFFQSLRITHLQPLLVFFERLSEPLEILIGAFKCPFSHLPGLLKRIVQRHDRRCGLPDAVVQCLYRFVCVPDSLRVGRLQLLLVLFQQLYRLFRVGYASVECAGADAADGSLRPGCGAALLFLLNYTQLVLKLLHLLRSVFGPIRLLLPELAQLGERGVAGCAEALHPFRHIRLAVSARETFEILPCFVNSSAVSIPHRIPPARGFPELFQRFYGILYLPYTVIIYIVNHIISVPFRP